jgi:hypothetical protein
VFPHRGGCPDLSRGSGGGAPVRSNGKVEGDAVRRTSALLLAAAVLAGCGPTEPGSPREVTLEELVTDQEGHDGEVLTLEGVVRSYDAPVHHWIEDADQHRVELEPQDLVAPLVGEEVRVTGRYSFEEDRGRLLEIDDLEVLGPVDGEAA